MSSIVAENKVYARSLEVVRKGFISNGREGSDENRRVRVGQILRQVPDDGCSSQAVLLMMLGRNVRRDAELSVVGKEGDVEVALPADQVMQEVLNNVGRVQ